MQQRDFINMGTVMGLRAGPRQGEILFGGCYLCFGPGLQSVSGNDLCALFYTVASFDSTKSVIFMYDESLLKRQNAPQICDHVMNHFAHVVHQRCSGWGSI